MTKLQLTLSMTDRGTLDAKLDAKIDAFLTKVSNAETEAAKKATQVSKSSFRRVRELAPPRSGRSGKGQLVNSISWARRSDGTVGLKQAELNAKAPHWIIQEIGTGQRAITRVAGTPRPTGRPTKGAQYVKTVKSQRGRRISPGLVFASRGGQYSPPGAAHNQQLYARMMVRGAPIRTARSRLSAPGIRISKEIRGQHFIKKGGQAGFREYRESVLAAARQQFKKSN